MTMGYYTQYRLEIKTAEAIDGLAVIEDLRNTCDEANYALAADGGTEQETKWYDNESDLKAFSLKYPHLLFILNGEGEESADLWKKYFKNGKMQVAKAEFKLAEFNPDLLK